MAQQRNHCSSGSNSSKKRKSTICPETKNKNSAAAPNKELTNELKRNMAPPPKFTQPSTSRTIPITEFRFPLNINNTSFPERFKNTSFTGNVQTTSKDMVQQRNHGSAGSNSCKKRKSTICPEPKHKNSAAAPNKKLTNELKRNMAPPPKFTQPSTSRTIPITEFRFPLNINNTSFPERFKNTAFTRNGQNTSKDMVQQHNHDSSGSNSCKKRKSTIWPGIKNINYAAALNPKLKLKRNMAPSPKFTQPSTSRTIPVTEFSFTPNANNTSFPENFKNTAFTRNIQNTSKDIVQQHNHGFSDSNSCKKRKSTIWPGNKNINSALNQKLKLKRNMAPPLAPPKFTQPSTSRTIPITEFSFPPNVQNTSFPQTAKDALLPPPPCSENPVRRNTQSGLLPNLEIDFMFRIMPKWYTSISPSGRNISRNSLCSTSRNHRPVKRKFMSFISRRCRPFTTMSTIQEEDINLQI